MSGVRNLDALDTSEPYDVCVIGSGPAGTIVSTQLAERGFRTLLLESGRGMREWALGSAYKQLAEYEVSGDCGYPLSRTTARLVGGNSNFWTGRCERFHPSDFEAHPYLPSANPWPIRYSDLRDHYAAAEKLLRVRAGTLSEYAPPRDGEPFPLPARPDVSALKGFLAAKAGVVLDDSPTATPAHAFRFFRFQREILPRFLRSGHGTLVSGATVTRLVDDETGRIVGAEVKTLGGATRMARARVFVVCCGGLQTPRLLLLSRSERRSRGIGNRYDRVGRGFNEHPSINVYGRLRHSATTLSLQHSIGRTHQFYETFRNEGLGAIHGVIIQSWLFPNHLIRYGLADVPKEAWKLLSRLRYATIYMSPTLEMLPDDANRVTLSEHRQDAFGNPIAHLRLSFSDEDRKLIERSRQLTRDVLTRAGAFDLEEIELTWSRHHLGSCRMGDSPTQSVVDADLRVHGCPNLYLCGSEVFVTGAAVQPVLTISAFALRLAEHLASGLSAGIHAGGRIAAPVALA